MTNFWKSQREDSIDIETRRNELRNAEYADESWGDILIGDCRTLLQGLEAKSVQVCITSPPYHATRSYGGGKAEIGHEATVNEYIGVLVQDVFRPIKRILADDGILWINIGDRVASGKVVSYTGCWGKHPRPSKTRDDLPAGNLLRIPDRLAAGLVHDGWVFRSEVIWEKTNYSSFSPKTPIPAHEKILMFTKSMKYQYYSDAVQLPAKYPARPGPKQRREGRATTATPTTKDIGTIWRIPSETGSDGVSPFSIELAERLILLSTKIGDTVLDPFSGTGTTGLAARRLDRKCTLIELNPAFATNARERIAETDQADAAD